MGTRKPPERFDPIASRMNDLEESPGVIWEELLSSGLWDQFWESPEVRVLFDATERLLKKGRGLTLEQIARLQSRLETLEDIRALPSLGVKRAHARREREHAEREEQERSAASQLIVGLPRIQ